MINSSRLGCALFLALGAACAPRAGGGGGPSPENARAALARAEADSAIKLAIADERARATGPLAPASVGVAPLTVDLADSTLAPLGYGLADLLITDLARSARLQVVDRIRVDALMRELGLAASGRVDSASAPRVGRLIAARRLLTGRVSSGRGSALVIEERIVDVERAAIEGSPSVTADRLEGVLDAEKAIALALFEALGVSLTPAERAAVEQRPTKNLAAFLAFSRGVREEALGRFDQASVEYGRALTADPDFTLAARHRAGLRPVAPRASLRAARMAHGSRAGGRELRGVVDAVNPSPAGRLGRIGNRGGDAVQSATQTAAGGTVIIVIFIPPST
ncbi:MAG: CsgG/HfaB family protein [Gemmatimonadota bacterium]|nr:CsgG/HfaB family protein [Gemmatimonadota bacterium]